MVRSFYPENCRISSCNMPAIGQGESSSPFAPKQLPTGLTHGPINGPNMAQHQESIDMRRDPGFKAPTRELARDPISTGLTRDPIPIPPGPQSVDSSQLGSALAPENSISPGPTSTVEPIISSSPDPSHTLIQSPRHIKMPSEILDGRQQ
ncbi:hypothetical protein CRG98_042235 [Punica granatum]|uniref:Uncharacterized protein n=1 Tax=Punica granatum TaxID=22663 RepID=A0A2I0I082_PUNGR|nr:hypothetical protein CRG98_042235 [Punica granatum]